MPLIGQAFLCLWNDFEEARIEEYERWHSFEHVPERVAAPGFLSGRRYADPEGTENRFMTLYDIETLAALQTPQYAALQAEPTEWSARMRPGFRNFLRMPCRTLASEGTGRTGTTAVLALSLPDGSAADDAMLLSTLREMLAAQQISVFHLGRADSIPAYGVFKSPERTDAGRHFIVALMETTLRETGLAALAALQAAVTARDPQARILRAQCVDLLFAVDHDEVDPALSRQPAQAD